MVTINIALFHSFKMSTVSMRCKITCWCDCNPKHPLYWNSPTVYHGHYQHFNISIKCISIKNVASFKSTDRIKKSRGYCFTAFHTTLTNVLRFSSVKQNRYIAKRGYRISQKNKKLNSFFFWFANAKCIQ